MGATLDGADLSGSDLKSANLSGASLRGAKLLGSDLRRASLTRASLRGADLRLSDFGDANLERADLSSTSLFHTNLSNAKISQADLTDASLGYTNLSHCAIWLATGLDTVDHEAPSWIDVETLYQSQGKVSLLFLRGAGVPENLITYMPSLVAPGAIQFYSCFISYSTKDQEFADRLHADLQNKGVRCWFAPHDVQSGKKLHEQIDEAIRMHERLLLILSRDSMASEWVKTEVRKARKRERVEKKRVLFPVRLVSFDAVRDWELFDADDGKDLATEIREYYIPDFSEWKNHDSYQKEFEKLLRDLRTKVWGPREKTPSHSDG